MFEDFEVKPMFADQVHRRHQFKLNVQGTDYQGIFHDGEIHWFNPHPKHTLEEGHIEAIESKVHDLMSGHLGEEFEVEPMFEGQVHERHQFKLNIDGLNYQGLYHDGEIHWFNPHPKNNLADSHVESIESEIHDKMSDHLEQ